MKGIKYDHALVNKMDQKFGWLILYNLHRYAESEEGQAVIKKIKEMVSID